jgi:hypothetical protein
MAKQEFDDTNRGVLFENTDKKGDKSPDFGGDIDVNGTKYRLSGWKASTSRGKTIRLAVSAVESGGYKKKPAPAAKPAADDPW